jgi:hypothetical protein
MHGLTGGGWKRSAGQGRSESCPGETPGRGAETYRRSTPPRQPPTLLRYGNSARVLGQVGNYALWRLGLWLSKKGNRRHGWRWGVTQVLLSPDHLGLASLHRTVIPPRPYRDWRGQAEHRR